MFYFRSNAALDTNCAVADVRAGPGRDLGRPEVADRRPGGIAEALGLPPGPGHGATSSGRRLVRPPAVLRRRARGGRDLQGDGQAGQADVAPHRRRPRRAAPTRWRPRGSGRPTPPGGAHLRAAAHQRRDRLQPRARRDASPRMAAQAARRARQPRASPRRSSRSPRSVPYNFGVVTQLLNETDERFNTGSMRNIYSPDVARAPRELVVDQLAARDGQGPATSSAATFLKDDRVRAVLRQGRRGRAAGAGRCRPAPRRASRSTRSTRAPSPCLVEIDCRPATVNRSPRRRHRPAGHQGRDRGRRRAGDQPARPRGPDAWAASCDGIALTLTCSLHLRDGHFLEGSWDNYFYTRQWNVAARGPGASSCRPTPSQPGGAGEAGVAASVAAVACAYARATGDDADAASRSTTATAAFDPLPFVPADPAVAHRRPEHTY